MNCPPGLKRRLREHRDTVSCHETEKPLLVTHNRDFCDVCPSRIIPLQSEIFNLDFVAFRERLDRLEETERSQNRREAEIEARDIELNDLKTTLDTQETDDDQDPPARHAAG